MKKQKEYYTFYASPFPIGLYFTISDKALPALYRKLGEEYEESSSAAFLHFADRPSAANIQAIMYVRDNSDLGDVEFIALIAHESLHFIQELRYLNNDEPFCHETEAYMLQRMINELSTYALAARTR